MNRVIKLATWQSGNALTDYFLEDVGITQNQFNVSQQLLSLGIVLLEVRIDTLFFLTESIAYTCHRFPAT